MNMCILSDNSYYSVIDPLSDNSELFELSEQLPENGNRGEFCQSWETDRKNRQENFHL
jgi:hypothetical protein